MEKVYIICLEYHDTYRTDFEVKATSTEERACEILKIWADEVEQQNSWIVEEEELDAYMFSDKYFAARYGELRATIWIEEKTIE